MSLAPASGVKIAVVMNAGAGSIGAAKREARKQEILAACAAAGIEARVHMCEPARLVANVRDLAARGADAIVAAGGDGTVSAVAGALVGGATPLAVLPLGTLNHFARDIGMPTGDVAAAIRAIGAFHTRWIDVGELNGRVFINNSSIGLYPEMLSVREHERRANGHSKWWAMLRASARVLRRFPLLEVTIAAGTRILAARTPFVFVGNNEYALRLLTLGARPALDRGQLSLYMIRSTTRLKMFWLMVRAFLQRLDLVKDFEAHATSELIVRTGRHRLRVALDGEVEWMVPPLHYRSRPQALRIVAPPPAVQRQDFADLAPPAPKEARG
jgi:diacylglycerol kinase family enzyme